MFVMVLAKYGDFMDWMYINDIDMVDGVVFFVLRREKFFEKF